MKTFDFSIIKTLRMKWGMTAEDLAARANITRATVAKIETGNGNPTIETLGALSRVFQISTSELIRMAEGSPCEEAATRPFVHAGLHGRHIKFPHFEMFHLKAGVGTRHVSEAGFHENTAEICLVVTGRLRLSILGETHDLAPSMAIRYKALHEHRIEIVEDAEFFLIHHNLY